MRKHTVKKQAVMGLWIAGLVFLGSAHATVVGVDSDWSTIGDLDGWFAGGVNPPALTNTTGYLSVSGPANAYRYAARAVDGGVLPLDAGSTLSLTFDLARDAVVGGELRVYLMNNTTDLDSYMFRASLGTSAADTRIGFLEHKYPVSFPSTTYKTGGASGVVGTDIGSDFDSFKFTIERTDADTLVFNLFRNGCTALLSVTKDYDDVDQSAADLLTSFGRVYIAWTDTLDAGESVYIDNVNLHVIPLEETLSPISVIHPRADGSYSTVDDLSVFAVQLNSNTVDEVQIRVDGSWVATDSSSPYEWIIPAGSLAVGMHQISLRPFVNGVEQSRVDRCIDVGIPQALWADFVTNSSPRLTDWGSSGYRCGERVPPRNPATHDVSDYGAVPDDGLDDTVAVQAAIDAAQAAGGGVVFFPPGQFDFNVNTNTGHTLRISHSDIVLRGSGPSTGGTTLKQWTCFDGVDWHDRYYLISAENEFDLDMGSIALLEDASRNAREIKLADTTGLNAGDTLYLQMLSSTNQDGSRSAELSLELVSPLDTTNAMGDLIYIEDVWSHFVQYAPYNLMVQIQSLGSDGQTAYLCQPLPRALETNHLARAFPVGSCVLTDVGVESFRIVGNFDEGSYVHHGSWEDDYGWGGVSFEGVANGWIRDISFEKMTADVSLFQSVCCTVEEIDNKTDGHLGIEVQGSFFNVVRNVRFQGFRTHNITLSAGAVANVFSSIFNNSGKLGSIDFHGGGRSSCNLVENSENFRIASGGATENMPHAGQYNTFWNIVAGDKSGPIDDMFSYGYYYYHSASPYSGTDLHQLYPKSILVGINNGVAGITVDGGTAFRDDEWLYMDAIGSTVHPRSLYDAQRDRKDQRLAFLRWKKSTGLDGNIADDAAFTNQDFQVLSAYATGENLVSIQNDAGNLWVSVPLRTKDPYLFWTLQKSDDLVNWGAASASIGLSVLGGEFSNIEAVVSPSQKTGFYRFLYWRDHFGEGQ